MSESSLKSYLFKTLLGFALLVVVQIGTLIWFLSDQHSQLARTTDTLQVLVPQHNELWYWYLSIKKEKKYE